MSGRYMESPCCGRAVVGMVDVTVHPRVRADGSFGPIADSLSDVKRYVRQTEAPDPHEVYCIECGETVEIPHECHEPWRHSREAAS